MIDVSAGLSDSIHKPIDASYYPDGWRRYMARAIKEVFPDKIVMTSGDIRNPQSACEILENQDTDLIGMGRQTIANPSWSHKVKTGKIDENKYAFVPILRAGMGMTEGIENLIPNAKIGVVGLYRNEETLKPVKYYYKVPKDIANRTVILLDPMLATGGSAIDAISMLKEDGVKNIKFLCIIAAPEGIKKLEETYPDVEVYCAKIDEKLNENGYILPGLGDAGDRIFGTK